MSTTQAKREYTAEQITAYEAYLSAVAEHNIVCARPAASTREKMDAATAQLQAFSRFCEIAGYPTGEARSLADVRRIEDLTASIRAVADLVRSAFSMVLAANGMGVIDRRAEGVDQFEHDACVCLFADAEVVLKAALIKADEE